MPMSSRFVCRPFCGFQTCSMKRGFTCKLTWHGVYVLVFTTSGVPRMGRAPNHSEIIFVKAIYYDSQAHHHPLTCAMKQIDGFHLPVINRLSNVNSVELGKFHVELKLCQNISYKIMT